MNGEIGIEADDFRVFAQQTRAYAVKSSRPTQRVGQHAGFSAQRFGADAPDPRCQLARRPARKSHQQNTARIGAFEEKMRHPMRQSVGLARASAGDDQQRRAKGPPLANAVFDGYRPWAGEIRARHTGSLVSDRSGTITPFALIQLADRGQFFVEPGQDTYEGMVVGINPRPEDLDINVTREKKLTNMRSSTADVIETLAKPLELDLEQAMEFCANDECVEVTPEIVRVRKAELDATTRARSRARAKARG